MFWQGATIIVLLAASAFFSGSETTLFALSRHELHLFSHSRRRSERLVATLMTNPRQLLLTLMICNVTINIFIFAASLSLFQQLVGATGWLAPILGMTSPVVVTLLGEILPKGTAIDLRVVLAPRIARLIRFCQIVLAPVVNLLNLLLVMPATRLLVGGLPEDETVTVEELRQLLIMSHRRQVIDADENAMLSGVVQLNELRVRDIVTPRVDMVAFDIEDPPVALAKMLRTSRLAKIPVYRGHPDQLLGVIYARQFFMARNRPLMELIRPIGFVPEIVTLMQLLRHFRQTATAMAAVVDEYGGLVGLVTIEDVAEQIVGELSLPEDADQEPGWEQLDERSYRVSGRLNLREWAELFHIRRFDERVSTLAGLFIAELGRLPEIGDRITLANVALTVESLRGRRIEWIRVEVSSSSSPQSVTEAPPAASKGGSV